LELNQHLSRITTPGRVFIPQIDGLRFVAIVTVIAYHVRLIGLYHFGLPADAPATDLVNWIFQAGHNGVALFFLVSGFILSVPFARQQLAGGRAVSLRDYFIRRLTRIEPPYLIHLAVLFLLCALVYRRLAAHQLMYGGEGWLPYAATHVGASLFYANGFIFGQHPYPNMVLWSLETEVQFYLLAPWLAKIFVLKNAWWRRGILAGAIIAAPLLAARLGNHYFIWVSLIGNIQFFLAGFLLADLYVLENLRPGRAGPVWDLVFLAAGAGVVWIEFHSGGGQMLPWVLLAAGLAAFLGRLTPAALSQTWIVTIGGMCYTIYLYHLLVISTLYRVTIHLQTNILWLDLLVQSLVMLPVILLVSAVLFALFERPFMRRDWPARALAVVFHKDKGKIKP
jgi:peptidoglycan/LPS O-acetylase OafA/YrhL